MEKKRVESPWQEIQVKKMKRNGNSNAVTVTEKGLFIPASFDAKPGNYALLKKGALLALKPQEDGSMPVVSYNKTNGRHAGRILRVDLVRIIKEHFGYSDKGVHRFKAWREGDMIIFGVTPDQTQD